MRPRLLAGTLAALLAYALPQALAAPRVEDTGQEVTVQDLVRDSLVALSRRSSSADRQFYRAGLWRSADEGCHACQIGPATAAAAYWRIDAAHGRWAKKLALGTLDRAVRDIRPDGAYALSGDAQSPDIATMFMGVELGTSYLLLKDDLGPARLRRYRTAIARLADYLIRNGNVTYYTNGNINIGNTELFYLAYRATGSKRFHRAYEASWRTTLTPARRRWAGYGLRLVEHPTRADGADGRGYLTESAGGRPGYDPEYAALQLDVSARLYLVSGDRRALRLANLLTNMLLPRVDRDMLLDTSGGTRHRRRGRRVPFTSPAVPVLARLGGRDDLEDLLPDHVARVARDYREALTDSHRNMYRGLGNQVATLLLALKSPRAGILPPVPRAQHARPPSPPPPRARRARAHRCDPS